MHTSGSTDQEERVPAAHLGAEHRGRSTPDHQARATPSRSGRHPMNCKWHVHYFFGSARQKAGNVLHHTTRNDLSSW